MRQKIEVMQDIQQRNEQLAAKVKARLTAADVFAVNILGCPGAGKTTVLTKLIPHLDQKVFIIEGDIASDIDTQKLNQMGIDTVQINTGGCCHLDAPMIEQAFPTGFSNGFLFIENIGNLVCPAEFLIGEHIKLLISSVTEGSDKPYKYPLAFEKADMVILNKCDLLEYVDFDEPFFMEGVRRLNPEVPVFKCAKNGEAGFVEAANWLMQKRAQKESV